MQIDTQCVHGGGYFDEKTRGLCTPVYTSSVYEYLDREDQPYPRYFNTPNQIGVVKKICALEGGEDGLVFGSGMAAISTALLSFLKSGDHAVIQDEMYGGTHAFVTRYFPRSGIDFTLVPTDAQTVIDAVKPNTRVIYIETPTNPLLNIIDIRKITDYAGEKEIITIIDNTFATPVNQRPIKFGIDVVVHSGTKYLGGHSDLCCGALVTSKALIQQIRPAALEFGGYLDALACYLLERSLKTLFIRMEKQTRNAGVLAKDLSEDRRIKKVYYPGLASHPTHDIARSQMNGFGAMLAFELDPDHIIADRFMRNLKLIRPALSLGGVKSTICDPATTSHAKVSAETRIRMGISDDLLRLSVGIENANDLMKDIEQALQVSK